jgi:hypothetical protein
MGEYTNQIEAETLDQLIDVHHLCIHDFTETMVNCLKSQEEKIDFALKKELILEVFKNSILGFYEYLDNDSKLIISNLFKKKEQIKYQYINFNYTRTFDKCLEILKSDKSVPIFMSQKNKYISYSTTDFLGKVIHVHGTLDNGVILGVDNKEQIENAVLRDDERIADFIIKPSENNILGTHNNKNVTDLINSSDIYCIYGMALGETDQTWWKKIAENLINNAHKQLVIFKWLKNTDFTIATDKIKQIKDCKNCFLTVADCENKNAISDRIHVSFNNELFDIKLVENTKEA